MLLIGGKAIKRREISGGTNSPISHRSELLLRDRPKISHLSAIPAATGPASLASEASRTMPTAPPVRVAPAWVPGWAISGSRVISDSRVAPLSQNSKPVCQLVRVARALFGPPSLS